MSSLISFSFFILILQIKIQNFLIQATKDSEVFVNHIQKIPSWEEEEVTFSSEEIKLLEKLINPGDIQKYPELYKKLDSKKIAIKCIYSYATYIIAMNVKNFPTKNVTNSPKRTTPKGLVRSKTVSFGETKLLVYDDDDTSAVIKDIAKEGSEDLLNFSNETYREDSITKLAHQLEPNKEYIVNIFKKKDLSYEILDDNGKYVQIYKDAIARMISVVIYSQQSPANWLWKYFLNLNALEKGILNLEEFYEYSEESINMCHQYIVTCRKHNYLHEFDPKYVESLSLKKKVKHSIDLLKKIKVLQGYDNELLPLFSYENNLGVYDFLFSKKTHQFDFYPPIEHINFKPIYKILRSNYKSAINEWKENPYLILKYYNVLSDVMKIALLYYSARHLINYMILTESVNKKPGNIKMTAEEMQDRLNEYYLKPSSIIRKIVRYTGISGVQIYIKIIRMFNDDKKNQISMSALVDDIFSELEILLIKYDAYSSILYKESRKGDPKLSIYNEVENECYRSLTNYYRKYKNTLGTIDFTIITFFQWSESIKWFS